MWNNEVDRKITPLRDDSVVELNISTSTNFPSDNSSSVDPPLEIVQTQIVNNLSEPIISVVTDKLPSKSIFLASQETYLLNSQFNI